MTIKNKDLIKLFQRLNKYFKKNESVFIEDLELTQKAPNYEKHIYIYKKNENLNYYDFFLNHQENKNPTYILFYPSKNNCLTAYFFKDLEESITNPQILKAFNILSNLKILKLEDF